MVENRLFLFGCKTSGSLIAEAFLTLTSIPFETIEFDYSAPGPQRDKLFFFNPLGQVPTLVLTDGEVLTETLAIALYANAKNPGAKLITDKQSQNSEFWRWAVFIVAAIYPTFTYGDTPGKWVPESEGAASLRKSTDEHRMECFKQLEKVCSAPYFLGDELSLIDIYVAAMTHWRPGIKWFPVNCPKLTATAVKVAHDPRLTELWHRHFAE